MPHPLPLTHMENSGSATQTNAGMEATPHEPPKEEGFFLTENVNQDINQLDNADQEDDGRNELTGESKAN